jgi:MSHA biogenesis protein MshN
VVSLLLKKGELSQVQQILNKGLEEQPNYVPYIKLKAEMMVQQGQISDALKLLLNYPPDIQEDTDYYAFIAALYQQNGQHRMAKEVYEKLLTLKPNNSTWWMGLGISLENMGDRRQAIEAFQMASRDASMNTEIKAYLESRLSELQ